MVDILDERLDLLPYLALSGCTFEAVILITGQGFLDHRQERTIP